MEFEKKTSNLILNDEKTEKKHQNYSNEIDNKSHKSLIRFENIKKNEEKNLNEYLTLLLNNNNQNNNEDNILTFLVTSQYNKSKKIFNDFMFKCCELNKEKFLNILLNCGCDINCQNEKGETLFHYAISKNNIKIIKLLIQYHPNKNLKTKNNLTIFDYAKKVKNPLIISLITEKKFEPKTNSNNNTFYFDDKYNFTLAKFYSKKNDIKISEISRNEFPLTRRNTKNTYFSSFIKSELFYDNPSQDNLTYRSDLKKNKNNYYIHNNYFKMNKENEDKRYYIFDNPDNFQYSSNQKTHRELNPNTNISLNEYNNLISKHKISLTEENMSKNVKQLSKETINQLNSNRLSTQSNNSSLIDNNSSKNFINKIKQPTNHTIEISDNDYNNESINIIDDSDNSSLIYNTYTVTNKQKINNTPFYNFFQEINISKNYTTLLNANGYDDLKLLIEQTKTGIVITDKILKEIGISSPGKRAKILIHLEEEAHLFDFQIEKDKVYNINERNENCLFKLLSSINLEKYFNNFKINDYNSPELLYVQMKSRQPLNDDILRSEIGIEKLGYRMRIINKLKSESINYIQKLQNNIVRGGKNNIIIFERKNNANNNDFCNMCFIY